MTVTTAAVVQAIGCERLSSVLSALMPRDLAQPLTGAKCHLETCAGRRQAPMSWLEPWCRPTIVMEQRFPERQGTATWPSANAWRQPCGALPARRAKKRLK